MSLNREICFVGKYPGIHFLYKVGCVYVKGHFSQPQYLLFSRNRVGAVQAF